MRQKLVAGNWKMNGSKASIKELLDGIKKGIGDVLDSEVAVCPPAIYLGEVESQLSGTPIAWGAQNLSTEASGAFTGEIAASMINDFNCKYVLVGHSERRTLYGEDDAVVAKKFAVARAAGLKPVLCIGETLEERESGVTEAVCARQIAAVVELEALSPTSRYGPLAPARPPAPNRRRRFTPSSARAWPNRMPLLPRRCRSSMAAA
jgi:triosephosphate isomerase